MFGQFAGMLSYFRLPDVYRLTFGLVVAALPLLIERIGILGLEVAVPRGVVLIDFVISLLAIGCFRVLIRAMRERTATTMQTGESTTRQRRVAIIGAGDVGAMVVSDLLAKRGLGRRPVAIFDDNAAKWGLRIHGIQAQGLAHKARDARVVGGLVILATVLELLK
jgi:FlaA1/EpsC-like NDP-sugar epimerase